MVSVTQVAEDAGVSSATVSRVLSGGAPVAAETRARVLESVEKLGYRPNAFARSLRSGRGRAVALVTGDIEQGVYAALARHVQSAVERIGLDLVLYNLGHREDRLRHIVESAPSLGLRGLLLASPHDMDMDDLAPLFRAAAEAGVTVVSLSQEMSRAGVVSLVHDDAAGAAMAVGHLLRSGLAPIAFLGRVATSAVGRERFNGYQRALAAAGEPMDPTLVWDIAQGYRAQAGYHAVSKALDEGVRVRSVLAASDELALGGMAAAIDRGLSVPEDLAVIGFGGLEWGRHTRPAITTVALDVEALGKAVGRLFSGLDSGSSAFDGLTIPPRLVVRGSA